MTCNCIGGNPCPCRMIAPPGYQGIWQPILSPTMGCVCPPTSEQTCQNPMCPRKNHLGGYNPAPNSTGAKP